MQRLLRYIWGDPPAPIIMDNSGERPLKVPGFGLPIKHDQYPEKRFKHGADDFKAPRMTVREVSMLRLMEALTDKPNWSTKVFDETITAKWRKEALQMPLISEKAFDWCLTELQDKAAEYEETKMVNVLDMASRCVKADGLVPPELRDALVSNVQPLLDQRPQDWHPGSNEQVLNLVHPSLFPAVYGVTHVLDQGHVELDNVLAPQISTKTLEKPVLEPSDYPNRRNFWSTSFQWLPCDVSFTDDTYTSVAITSYINNLHPATHASLYHTIEEFISLCIPAWNQVLIQTDDGRTPSRIISKGARTEPDKEPDWAHDLVSDPDAPGYAESLAKVQEYMNLPDKNDNYRWDPPHNWETTGRFWETIRYKWERIRETIHPEPGTYPSHTYANWRAGKLLDCHRESWEGYIQSEEYQANPELPEYTYTKSWKIPFTWTDDKIRIQDTFRSSGLQVIVKLSSIELTPSSPDYPGGNWHLEGMKNEHIIATAIYYYSVSNITESRIRFRQEAHLDSSDMSYAQDDHQPLADLYGAINLRDDLMIQETGSITTPQGRLLVFPNTLQHKVEPFRLADPSKPGHRRFLVLWLIDPNYRVLSTRNVPPQQYDWWAEKARETVQGKVPAEIGSMIAKEMKGRNMGTMTLDEAKAYRLALMEERTSFTEAVQEAVEEYNFCEH